MRVKWQLGKTVSVALVLHTTLSKTIGKFGCHFNLPDKSTYGLIFFMYSRSIDNADFSVVCMVESNDHASSKYLTSQGRC